MLFGGPMALRSLFQDHSLGGETGARVARVLKLLQKLFYDIFYQIFPDITICNAHPLGHIYDEELTWNDYVAAMTSKKADWPYEKLKLLIPNLQQKAYNSAWDYLLTPGAYFSSLPMDSWKVRNSDEQLILKCAVYGWDWTVTSDIDCAQEPILQTNWDPDYHHCYMIRMPEERKQAS